MDFGVGYWKAGASVWREWGALVYVGLCALAVLGAGAPCRRQVGQ